MPEQCYEKCVSNLIRDVCVAIFAEYSRVEDWKSRHRKLNSLFETFSIPDTIIAQDKFLVSRHSINLTIILLKCLVLARRTNTYTAQDHIISTILLLSLVYIAFLQLLTSLSHTPPTCGAAGGVEIPSDTLLNQMFFNLPLVLCCSILCQFFFQRSLSRCR